MVTPNCHLYIQIKNNFLLCLDVAAESSRPNACHLLSKHFSAEIIITVGWLHGDDAEWRVISCKSVAGAGVPPEHHILLAP